MSSLQCASTTAKMGDFDTTATDSLADLDTAIDWEEVLHAIDSTLPSHVDSATSMDSVSHPYPNDFGCDWSAFDFDAVDWSGIGVASVLEGIDPLCDGNMQGTVFPAISAIDPSITFDMARTIIAPATPPSITAPQQVTVLSATTPSIAAMLPIADTTAMYSADSLAAAMVTSTPAESSTALASTATPSTATPSASEYAPSMTVRTCDAVQRILRSHDQVRKCTLSQDRRLRKRTSTTTSSHTGSTATDRRMRSRYHVRVRKIRKYGRILRKGCKGCRSAGVECRQLGAKTRCERCYVRMQTCSLCSDGTSDCDDDVEYHHAASVRSPSTVSMVAAPQARLQLAVLLKDLEEFDRACEMRATLESQRRSELTRNLSAIVRSMASD